MASAGGTDVLVTGDGDLPALAPRFPIPAVSPATLRERLNDPASLPSGTAPNAHEAGTRGDACGGCRPPDRRDRTGVWNKRGDG